MTKKIAAPIHYSDLKECAICHGYSDNGFILKDKSIARFVDKDCYRNVVNEYPIATKTIEIKRTVLNSIVPERSKLLYQVGYLFGCKYQSDSGYRIVISSFHECSNYITTTVYPYNREDIMLIRRKRINENQNLVGMYRTSPSGISDLYNVDLRNRKDLLLDIPYVIIAGSSEIQIRAIDKNFISDEIGIVIN